MTAHFAGNLRRLLFAYRGFLVLYLLCINPCLALAQATTVFRGRPDYVIEEFGITRQAGEVDPKAVAGAEVVISEIEGKFYWASRENRELTKNIGGDPVGSIITYSAQDGSGYVRVVTNPLWKATLRQRFPNYDLDYTEHLLQALGSLTYFGREINSAKGIDDMSRSTK